jgi:tetratricopeptide (TPR) repeat protein
MLKFLIAFIFISVSSFAQTTLERGKSLYESTRYKEAIETLKLISKTHSDYAAAQYYLGRIEFDKKNYEDASEYFDEATSKNPKSSEYFNWLGDTYGRIAQDANPFKQAMLAPKMKKAWESAIALDPKNLNARLSLIQFYLLAPGIMGGSIEKAKETANQIIAIKPAEGHRQMGIIFAYDKKNAEAESEYQKMAAADPAYTSQLVMYYQGQKQYSKAFDVLDRIVKKNPDDYASIYQVGKTAALSGQRMDQGEECLKKYLTYEPQKNEPNHAGANMRLAQIQEKKGKKADAKRYFETALKLDPNLKEAKEGLARCTN